MSIKLPSDSNADLPPDDDEEEGEEGSESSLEQEDEEVVQTSAPNPEPAPKRSSGSIAASISVPKRQKPTPTPVVIVEGGDDEPNPFDTDALVAMPSPFSPAVPTAAPLETKEKRAPDDECLICKEPYRFPVVECVKCEHPMCHKCLKVWSVHLNRGGGDEKVASCPNCRSTEGYRPHTYLNRLLGEQVVECERCKKQFPNHQLKLHATERCLKRKVTCSNQRYGCKWTGNFDVLEEHEQGCNFKYAAEVKAKIEEMKASFAKELLEMRKEKDQLTDDLESTIEKGRKRLESLVNSLSSLQQALKHGNVAMFTKGRRNDTVSISVQSAEHKSLDLQLKISVDEDKFYKIHAQFVDPAARFPIHLGVYFMNPNVPGIEGPCKTGSYFFRLPGDSVELYNELESWDNDRERALAERGRAVMFSICGGILLSGESRT